MQNLPDLTQLSHGHKDELIKMLWPLQQQVRDLMAQMVVMQDRIKQLEGRLALNSRNSSPPSSDSFNKPAPKSLSVAGQRPTGGQKGHTGSTLSQVAQPDKIVIHGVPDQCQACQSKLLFAYVGETRQVFDFCHPLSSRSPNTRPCKPSAPAGKSIRGSFLLGAMPQCNTEPAHRPPWPI